MTQTPPDTWTTYLVTQESVSARSTPEVVRRALSGGIDAVQLREKGTAAADRHELGRKLRELTREADVPLIVNDRADLARAIDADGVHVGQSDLPVPVARELVGPDRIVGCSASTVPEARRAEEAGADYLGVGAVYGTDSKDVADRKDGIGPERIAAIAEATSIPVVGIGGITADNAGSVVEAGAAGVAVVGAIAASSDPESATRGLRAAIESE
ncbi:thiamine phosphate synthase [Saliphagus sp. LR7]|uniref:thiamine phosphate synthase n=1 Tax=Saliphagus sp. LR7 TaxID=2282654 RepID=UPI000DF7862A|nr:thiamine phosphate synthase [Saliphagus sp. LR7]